MGRARAIEAKLNRNLMMVLWFHIIEVYGTPSSMVKSRKVYFPTCEICGELFTSMMAEARMCSTKCRSNAYWLRVAPQIYEPRECKECGKMFAPGYGDQRIVYCSILCGGRYARKQIPTNARKRARHYGVEYEHINLRKVFDRDGWCCQICGRKTPQSMRGKLKPTAPELDHRVPMSNGGGHLYSNVQCACRRCNRDKSNHSSVGQLPMFDVGEVPYTGYPKW